MFRPYRGVILYATPIAIPSSGTGLDFPELGYGMRIASQTKSV